VAANFKSYFYGRPELLLVLLLLFALMPPVVLLIAVNLGALGWLLGSETAGKLVLGLSFGAMLLFFTALMLLKTARLLAGLIVIDGRRLLFKGALRGLLPFIFFGVFLATLAVTVPVNLLSVAVSAAKQYLAGGQTGGPAAKTVVGLFFYVNLIFITVISAFFIGGIIQSWFLLGLAVERAGSGSTEYLRSRFLLAVVLSLLGFINVLFFCLPLYTSINFFCRWFYTDFIISERRLLFKGTLQNFPKAVPAVIIIDMILTVIIFSSLSGGALFCILLSVKFVAFWLLSYFSGKWVCAFTHFAGENDDIFLNDTERRLYAAPQVFNAV
jgi:hypothetical protein